MKRLGLITALIGVLLAGCQEQTSRAELSVDGYAISEGTLLVVACSSCHLGEEDTGGMAGLNGWTSVDMRATLLRYKTEDGGTTVMHRLARGYSDADIQLISEFFEQQND